jgi:hypothetical protein
MAMRNEREPVHAPHPPLKTYFPSETERRAWVRDIFDRTAVDYDRVERAMAFGSGPWYRRQARSWRSSISASTLTGFGATRNSRTRLRSPSRSTSCAGRGAAPILT